MGTAFAFQTSPELSAIAPHDRFGAGLDDLLSVVLHVAILLKFDSDLD
jgi:hypothetical protein